MATSVREWTKRAYLIMPPDFEDLFKQEALEQGLLDPGAVIKADTYQKTEHRELDFPAVVVQLGMLTSEQVSLIRHSLEKKGLVEPDGLADRGGPLHDVETLPRPAPRTQDRSERTDAALLDSDSGVTIHLEKPSRETLEKKAQADPDTLEAMIQPGAQETVEAEPAGGSAAETVEQPGGGEADAVEAKSAPPAAECGTPGGDPFISREVGGCKILSVLGEGGMGVVYKAEDISLARTVALKILPKRVTKKPVLVERFKREARAAAQVEHPNIVQVYRVGQESDDLHYIVMQYVRGENLGDKVTEEGRLDHKTATNMMFNVAQGLVMAHEHGIIHRDIKPDNIMLTDKNEVKLADFGLARDVQSDSDISQTGQVLGTPYYMSPEQCDARPVDGRADIYSLGATFYYLVTGVKPFTGDTPYQVLMKHITEPLVSPREFAPDLPEEVSVIIEKMMAKDPADRYPNCEALSEDLGGLLKKWDLLDADYVITQPKARWPLWVTGAAVALVLIGGLATGLFFLKKRAEENFQKKAHEALVEARKKAEEAVSRGAFTQAAAVFDGFIKEYGNSTWKGEAEKDREEVVRRAKVAFRNEVDGISARLDNLETDQARAGLVRVKGFELSPEMVKDVQGVLRDLEDEVGAVEKIKPLLRSVETVLDSKEKDKYSRLQKSLGDMKDSVHNRIRKLTEGALTRLGRYQVFEGKLAKAGKLAGEEKFDKALEVLLPCRGDDLPKIASRCRSEIAKIESMLKRDLRRLNSAVEQADKAVARLHFTEALSLVTEFKTVGAKKIQSRARTEEARIRKERDLFKLNFEEGVGKARRYIDTHDYSAAEKVLRPFAGSDLADVRERLGALLGEVRGRKNTPSSFAFIPGHGGQEPFYLQKYEVTNREYRLFLEENPSFPPPRHWGGREVPAGLADHPVVNVSRTDAQAYANWLSTKRKATFRLPSEKEWTRCAEGKKGRIYPFGSDSGLLTKINLCKPETVNTRALTQDRTPEGVVHLAGNVSEWTATSEGKAAVIKGGSFADPDHGGARCRFRILWRPHAGGHLPFVGFRLAADVKK